MTVDRDHMPSSLRYEAEDRTLILRPARVSDATEVHQAVQATLADLQKFMQWSHLPLTAKHQKRRITKAVKDYKDGRDLLFHLYQSDGGPFVGTMGLHHRTLSRYAFEIGYWIHTEVSGRGLATLGSQCLLVLAFDYLGCHRIQCGYNEANLASQRVNEKVGFVFEGRMRNFETPPTEELVQNGLLVQPYTVMNVLFPEDRARLEWYTKVAKNLRVLDADGKLASPGFSME